MEAINEQPVTDAEAKELIQSLSGEGKELKYDQKNSFEVLEKFVSADMKNVKELSAELLKIGKLKDRQIVSVANVLPKDRDDLRAVLGKEYSTFTEDEINLVLETVKKFA